MTQFFGETGEAFPVTVLAAAPNVVVQRKTESSDGYSALQLGFGERRANLFSRAERGHFEKAGVAPQRHVRESRMSADEAEGYEVGQEISCEMFETGQLIDVIGVSKGRGTAGVVKRHGVKIKKRTHGTHEAFRHSGSIGAGAYPGRVIKGMRMAGRMGNERVTVRNLEVVQVDGERNLLFVRGGIPGHNDGLVCVRSAVASHR
jgi:large subunit ribosomal protein L3